jgi:2-methylisocitrate lyase-like PEP mutase family enzyme
MDQKEKATRFKELHERDRPFVIPNPYDPGTARLLAGLGFKALASTSAGYAYSRGTVDHKISADEMFSHLAELASATDLPLNADLGNGFGDSPDLVADGIRRGIDAGLAGGSIEDMAADRTLYSLEHSAERIAAAAEVAHGGDIPFVLTARAENYLVGDPSLSNVIERLQTYQEAGADVLYAPGLNDIGEITELCRSVDRPVNVLVGLPGHGLKVEDFAAAGVTRLSTGSALAVAAFGAFLRAAKEMRDEGSFSFADDASAYGDLGKILG